MVTSRGVIDGRRNPRISKLDAEHAGVLGISRIPRQHPHTTFPPGLPPQQRLQASLNRQPWTCSLRHWPTRSESIRCDAGFIGMSCSGHGTGHIGMTIHTGGIMLRSVTSRVEIEEGAGSVDPPTEYGSIVVGDITMTVIGIVRCTAIRRRRNTGPGGNRTGLQQLTAAQCQGIMMQESIRKTIEEVRHQSRLKGSGKYIFTLYHSRSWNARSIG